MLSKPTLCLGCPLYQNGLGFVDSDGEGSSGVLIVLEAGGEVEAETGKPVTGKSGYFLFQQLQRVGIERDIFRIDNCCKCRPFQNKLAGQPYEREAIEHCTPLLDTTIVDMQEKCKQNGKHFTILTLGRIAFKRIMGYDDKSPVMREDFDCYTFWLDKYQAFVIAAPHPSYLMRGNSHLIPILQFAAKRALEIAEHGMKFHEPIYLKDPEAATFAQWVKDCIDAKPEYLACDIETPHKQGKDEEKVAKEDDDDYVILRCSFCYKPGEAVSVPWRAEYLPLLEDLLGSNLTKIFHNQNYDVPRISVQLPIGGTILDSMLAFHVLQSALPKGLGFITPFFCPDMPLWKHLSDTDPAGYNCQDSDACLRDFLGIKAGLESNNQGHVFDRHVVLLNKVLSYMSGKGVLRDNDMRAAAEKQLQDLLDVTELKMQASVPQEAKRLKVYKKTPKEVCNAYKQWIKDRPYSLSCPAQLLVERNEENEVDKWITQTTGFVRVKGERRVTACPNCNFREISARHYKSIGKKRLKTGEAENPCVGLKSTKIMISANLWAKPLDFKVSKVGLSGYQKALRHQAVINRKENRVTFDEDAIRQLMKKYPHDHLYPLILENREYSKLLGTYVGVTQEDGTIRGGMQIGRDGKIHPLYTSNPSTLRLACQSPNMQNLPRSKREDDLQTIVRNLIVACPGCSLLELDFSAIEAVLVGYFAGSADYIRLAKLGIHSFLASHVLGRPADLSWSDADLKTYFKEIKKSEDPHVQDIYNSAKRTTHLSGYGGTPMKMHLAEPEAFPTKKDAERLQGIYFEICPYIKKWQLATQLQADKDGFLRNPFGYVHRFNRVFSYKKEFGKWVRSQGEDANRALAFLPQSTAAGIIKEAMLRLWYKRFEEAGQYLRLQVHDSLVAEVPLDKVEEVCYVMREEMTKPVPELRLPKSYGLGECLSIDVEVKQGEKWGSMRNGI